MAKYKAGDKILVNGQLMTLGSWPDDDTGPFFATYTNNEGGVVQGTYWAGTVKTEGEPVHTSSNVQLVEEGEGVTSTAGDLDDLADEPEPSLSDDAEAEAEAAEEATEVEAEGEAAPEVEQEEQAG